MRLPPITPGWKTFAIKDRIRYLLSVTTPIFKNKKYPSFVLSDELAIQFGKEVVYNTFEQNRLFFGSTINGIIEITAYCSCYIISMISKIDGTI